jgi:hypothetical protein
MEKDEVTFETLAAAINFVEEKGKVAETALSGYQTSFFELTGFNPGDRNLSALDIAKIYAKLSGQ